MGIFQDLTGQTSGTLIAKEYLGGSKWLCVCQVCNNEVIITTDWFHKNIRLGRDGCKHAKPITIGDTFGYLRVIAPAKDYIKPKSKAREKQWLCECVCGRQKEILESNLKAHKSLTCGICSNRVSIPEKMIYFYLSQYFTDIQEQYRPEFLGGKELDIYLPALHVGIEYDGYRWHKELTDDEIKNEICKNNGIFLIRIREPHCPDISNAFYCIKTPRPTTNGTHMTQPIKELIAFLNQEFLCSINLDVDCIRDNADICKRIISTVGFNSLEYLFPEIAKEWDYEKNYPLTPDKVPAHTGKKAWWICPKCKQSYASVIASRTGNKRHGCRKCQNTKKVYCIELDQTFESLKSAAQVIGRKSCSITSSIKNNTTCAGYHWKYVTEE